MIKRVVVAGYRNFNDYNLAEMYIDHCISKIKTEYELIFVSGGCRGADKLGEEYAIRHGYDIEQYLADWELYGKYAGPKRNEQMARVADYVICFWDGKSIGTKSMIYYANKYKKPLKIKMIKL